MTMWMTDFKNKSLKEDIKTKTNKKTRYKVLKDFTFHNWKSYRLGETLELEDNAGFESFFWQI